MLLYSVLHLFNMFLLRYFFIRQGKHLEQYWKHGGKNICLAIHDFKTDVLFSFQCFVHCRCYQYNFYKVLHIIIG